ncbi:MAG: UPF0175 family protein [Candidatus Aenigmarchaeota archaeon]|nr:UPF0175 family protein [Candidatus Aenigmarchaeota archaeon]
MPVTITTRVGEQTVKKIDRIAKEAAADRSTAIRKMLEQGVKEWSLERALNGYEEGRLTLWQAARRAELSLWEMVDEVKKRHIHAPYTLEELKEDLKGL